MLAPTLACLLDNLVLVGKGPGFASGNMHAHGRKYKHATAEGGSTTTGMRGIPPENFNDFVLNGARQTEKH